MRLGWLLHSDTHACVESDPREVLTPLTADCKLTAEA